jgi:cytochrome c-type biogenesis protein CcmH/NrfG
MMYLLFAILLAAALAVILWPMRAQRRLCAIIAFVFFIGAFGLYYFVGTPQIVPLMEARNARLAELKASIIKSSETVKTDPKNLGAWVELGADFVQTGQYNAAANAFKQAVILSKGDPALILAYAKAMIADNDGKVTPQAKKSLQMVLLQDKQNAEARYYLAVEKLQSGKTKEAMRDMKALYKSLPDNSPVKQMIDRQIGRN